MNNTNDGIGSLNSNTGNDNTAFGAYAGYSNLAAPNNTMVGSNSAFYNTTGKDNTSIGAGSLCNNTTGSLNTALGANALEGKLNSSVGNQNVAVGVQSLYSNGGSSNTSVGAYAAATVLSGNYNTFLGANTSFDVSSNIYNYSTAIGYGAIIDASNQIMMGTTSQKVIIPNTLTSTNDITVNSLTIGQGKSDIPGNTAVGTSALANNSLTGFGNAAFGYFALAANTDGSFNTALGYKALTNSTTAAFNTAVGHNALLNDVSGSSNTAVGHQALVLNNGSGNSAFGVNALVSNTTGLSNTAIGTYAAFNGKVCSNNTSIGYNALYNNNNINNTAIGINSGINDVSGNNNTYLGASTNCTPGSILNNSTAIGYGSTITASNQIMMGTSNETVIIPNTLTSTNDITVNSLTIGKGGGDVAGNTALGTSALATNSGITGSAGVNNTAVGFFALGSNTTGGSNTAVGYNALGSNTSEQNTAVGTLALINNITGSNNTAVGTYASFSNVTGSDNTALGYSALNANKSNYNTAVGFGSLDSNIDGYNNVALGINAGGNDVSGNANTYLGGNTSCSSGGPFYQSTVIGYGAQLTASNQIMMGTTTENVYIPGTLSINQRNYTTLSNNANLGPAGPTGANTYQTGYSSWNASWTGATGTYPPPAAVNIYNGGESSTNIQGMTGTFIRVTSQNPTNICIFTIPSAGVWNVNVIFSIQLYTSATLYYTNIAVCTDAPNITNKNVVLPFYYFTNIGYTNSSGNPIPLESLSMQGIIITTGSTSYYVNVYHNNANGSVYYNAYVYYTKIG